jgi:DNA-binding LytR/AlgR family response regulator
LPELCSDLNITRMSVNIDRSSIFCFEEVIILEICTICSFKIKKVQKINCLIVDDEPLALDLLERYIQRISFLDLKGRCYSAFEALEILGNVKIDLIFLDIQMPELTGMEFSRILGEDVKIIFTTAFSKYAVDGFKVNAIDYLLKPFSFDGFLKASNKAREWFDLKDSRNNPVQNTEEVRIIFVKSEYKQVRIVLDDIYCFEGLKDYVKIWTKGRNKPVMTLMSLKSLEEMLPGTKFMRIHRSFIISLDKIHQVERNDVLLINNVHVTVSDPYRSKFNNYLSGRSIS